MRISRSNQLALHKAIGFAACIVLLLAPGLGRAEIIWAGDYETANFLQWHMKGDKNYPQLSGVPAYGRPQAPTPFVGTAAPGYYGDGSLLSLVTSPVRQGDYAAKFTVKSSKAGGSEPDDCDNGNCGRRRSELNVHLVLQPVYKAMPYMSERWVSVSHYLPSDWDSSNGSSWGPTVFQIKSPRTNSVSPMLSIIAANQGWQIQHRWSHQENPDSWEHIPWQYQMYYDPEYPTSSNWADGLKDFPNVTVSRQALADLNKGGWTDWVIRLKFDGRGSAEGGTGYITVWKRAGNEDWIKVLHITPKQTTRGNMSFDHGIGYKVPDSGYGVLAGLYMDKEQVWNLPTSRYLYNDNVKVGGSSATFADMSPDASSPGSAGGPDADREKAPPKPPTLN